MTEDVSTKDQVITSKCWGFLVSFFLMFSNILSVVVEGEGQNQLLKF